MHEREVERGDVREIEKEERERCFRHCEREKGERGVVREKGETAGRTLALQLQ